METLVYNPQGVCSKQFMIEHENGKIVSVKILGGCNGNLQGISKLLIGMSIEEAISILDPETSADAITEIKYHAGFNKEKAIEKVEEACVLACDIMREHLEDTEIMFSNDDCYDDLKRFSQERLISLFLKMKKLFNKACEQCDKLEKENIELTDLDKLIDEI